MPTNIYKPRGQLQGLVDFFWYCNERIHDLHVITLPIAHLEIVFNYSTEYSVSGKDQKAILKNCPTWISGLQSRQTTTQVSNYNENIGVVFTPTGLNAFTKIPLSEFSDRHLPVNELWKNDANALYYKMADSANTHEKFRVLESFLIGKLNGYQPKPNLVQAMRFFNDPSSAPKIYQLCKILRTSRKSLTQLFLKNIGWSPGNYKRLLIFNRALIELNRLDEQKLSDIGYNLDYVDQSHFIREFSAFSGMTPGTYYKYVSKSATNKEEPNFILSQGG